MVTPTYEVFPDIQVVVDLAIKDDSAGPVLVRHGLGAAGEINHAQSAHGKSNTALQEESVFVWTAMLEAQVHALQVGTFDRGAIVQDAGDSTHSDYPVLPSFSIGPMDFGRAAVIVRL